MAAAVITGASSGIGYEFARLLAAEKFDLALVARNLERLNEIRKELESRNGVRVIVIPADLARPEAPDEIAAELRQAAWPVEILINNAGFGYCGPYLDQPDDNEADMIRVNVISLARLTRLLVPEMIERKQGYICNVASTAAFFPGPHMAVYYATKAYVVSYSRALRNELREHGIRVSALCPGPTATNFQNIAHVADTRMFRLSHMATAKEVAAYGYRALRRNQSVAIPGFTNKLMVVASRFLPRDTVTAMVRWVQETHTT